MLKLLAMLNNTFIFIVALFMVIKGSTLATTYASRLAESFRLSKYTVGFIIVAIISILPETFISVNAALNGLSSFGLGVLFGSNIADLTLIFFIIVFATGRGLKIESKILKNNSIYPFLLLLPVCLGLDGYYSRWEGGLLILVGGIFYLNALRKGTRNSTAPAVVHHRLKTVALLVFSMAALLIGSHFIVVSASEIALMLRVSPILIGMLIVGLGTTMPELFFSLRSVEKHQDSLAVGDILGTVLADATVVVGILALVNPFYFPQKIIYITGMFMVVASIILLHLMRTGRSLTKREAVYLFIFWITFVLVEFFSAYLF